ALDGARHLGQRRIARVAPVARVEGAVEVHEEVEQGVVRPRLAGQVEGVVRVRHVLEREVRIEADGETVEHDRVLELLGEVLGLDQPRGGGRIERLGDVGARDRKSTRLNSSHVSISYAVFCLKKKKHKTTTTR